MNPFQERAMSHAAIYNLVTMIGQVLGGVLVCWLERQTRKIKKNVQRLRELRVQGLQEDG
jgi:hypothetical protein